MTANKFGEDAETGEATVESGIPVMYGFFINVAFCEDYFDQKNIDMYCEGYFL